LGTVTASQISHGRENDIYIEIDGTKGSMFWRQENPNEMIVRQNGQPHKIYTRSGGPYIGTAAAAATRIPAGHPEGYLEGFANLYRSAYDAMILRAEGKAFEKVNSIYPNVNDGLEGMFFIQQCVASSKENGAWLPLAHKRARK
jgi:predicted dehydrogenase